MIKIDFFNQPAEILYTDHSFLVFVSFVVASYFPGAACIPRACMTIQNMLIDNMIKLL